MISEERKDWIEKNRVRGDIKVAVAQLNKRGHPVTLAKANQIIFNDVWGQYGKIVWNELEKVIKKRIAQLQKEKELYAASQ